MIAKIEVNKRYFREAYRSGKHGWEAKPSPYVLRFLYRLRGELPGAALLDVGCGEGRHAIAAARRGFRVTGADFEPLALARARAAAREAGAAVRLVKADALALPFPGSLKLANARPPALRCNIGTLRKHLRR